MSCVRVQLLIVLKEQLLQLSAAVMFSKGQYVSPVVHGTDTDALPQNDPIGHGSGLRAPPAQKNPGLQVVHSLAKASPEPSPRLPTGQGIPSDTLPGQKRPVVQATRSAQPVPPGQ